MAEAAGVRSRSPVQDDWLPIGVEFGGHISEEQAVWRMKGILDCLRMQKKGPLDPKYIEYLVWKTGEKAP